MRAPSAKPSPPRWALALGALAFVVALATCAFLVLRGPEASARRPTTTASAPTVPPASAPRLDVAARPRAGVSGRVLDPQKQPVAAATVCAWAVPASGLTTAELRAPRCVVTDATGAYALRDLYPATPLSLTAAAATFPPARYHGDGGDDFVRLAEGEQRAGVDFVLRAGGVLVKGRVADATGGVVAGAMVATESGDAAGRGLTTSDAKGEFTLWVDPGSVRLAATAVGYAPGHATGPAPGHFFTIYVVPGAVLVGRAVIAGGETPVIGALVEAIQVEGGGARASTRSAADGTFRIEGLVPGRYRIEANAEGRAGYSRASVTLGMGETSSEVIVELDPAYVVRGQVVEKDGGAPCTGGSVTITDHAQNEFSQATIEPDGWARMASVIPGTYKVEVRCKGHVERDEYPPLTIARADAPPQRWEVEKGASVRVVVVDGQGNAPLRVEVDAYPTGPEGGPSVGTDHPEADGAFLLAGLKAGPYNVLVHAQDGSRGTQEITVTGSREERIKITLPLSGAIDGVVEDADHRPVANVQVSASGPGHAAARSLDDGTFTLLGLPPGEYLVVANDRAGRRPGADDDAKKAPPPPKVTVTAQARARARVVVESRAGVIEGRVVDASGQPIIDAFLDVGRAVGSGGGVPRYGGSNRPPVITDPEGRFKIENLAEGEYNLRAYRKGGGEATAEHVKANTRGITLRLGDGASFEGILSTKNGPVERFTLRVHDTKTAFNRMELFFHAGGRFALRDLPAGTYDVVAETPIGSVASTITLAEGERKSGLALTLALRGVVEGRFVDAEGGAPLVGVMATIDGNGRVSVVESEAPTAPTGRDGRFRIEGVLAGSWTLEATAPDDGVTRFEPLAKPIEVLDGGGVTDVGAIAVRRRAVPAPGM